MQQQTDHSGAIWLFGILLVLAWAANQPYWQNVLAAAATGRVDIAKPLHSQDIGSGLMVTAGLFLLVIVLAGIAKISSNAGAFALVFLLALWVLFLLKHTGGVNAFFGQFTPKSA